MYVGRLVGGRQIGQRARVDEGILYRRRALLVPAARVVVGFEAEGSEALCGEGLEESCDAAEVGRREVGPRCLNLQLGKRERVALGVVGEECLEGAPFGAVDVDLEHVDVRVVQRGHRVVDRAHRAAEARAAISPVRPRPIGGVAQVGAADAVVMVVPARALLADARAGALATDLALRRRVKDVDLAARCRGRQRLYNTHTHTHTAQTPQ